MAELDGAGHWARGYVYLGGELLAVQQGGVFWSHQDPFVKSRRVTDGAGNVTSLIELDPWGGATGRMWNASQQPRWFTSYLRDGVGSDEALHRRYNRYYSRFEQPDPYDGSYDLSDPQSLNRYTYARNDPVNFTDPSGLCMIAYLQVNGGPVQTLQFGCTFNVTGSAAGTMTSGGGVSGGGGGSFFEGNPMLAESAGNEGGAGGGVVGAPPQKPVPDTLTSNQDVLDEMYCLWKRGGYGFKPTERSMWITQQNNAYVTVPWPWSAKAKEETWTGPRPAGAVAIAHTHPDRNFEGSKASPKPSTTGGRTGRGDQGTADQTGLPVYVVTGQAIWKAVPNAKNPVQVAGPDWYKPSEKAKVKC